MKIAFVLPWFGQYCFGGAESEAKNTAINLQNSGMEVEILTTCLKNSHANWNEDFYRPGLNLEAGLKVRRFPVRPGDHGRLNKMIHKIRLGVELSPAEEKIFARENVRSLEMNQYILEYSGKYDFFIYIPYLFGTTIDGAALVPEKSLLIPCLHNENFARLKLFTGVFGKFRRLIFHAAAEKKLARELYGGEDNGPVLGEGVNTDLVFSPGDFKKKYGPAPYLLFVGRKDEGKNLPLVLNYFKNYKNISGGDLKLVLVGYGAAEVPAEIKNDVLDLGYVPEKEKLAAYADALLTVQPSLNESFSLVIMESWLAAVPVLVNGFCQVTKDHCLAGGGGLYFENFREFSAAIDWFLANSGRRREMGASGRKYVLENFSWPVIVRKYQKLFAELNERKS